MKHLTLLLLLIFSSSAFAQIKVACVGNSITYGHGIEDREHDTYPAQLQAMLGDSFLVENFGVSGTTAQKEGDFPWTSTKEYEKAKAFLPDVVVIKLGTNDSKPQNWVGSERFTSNLETLANEFASLSSHPRIIIALPAKAFEFRWSIRDSVICSGELKQIKKMAKTNRWRCIDLYKITAKIPESFPDGIHPNPQGAGVIATEVKKAVIKEATKKLTINN
ncbi:MAG: GDSL-type esterase/lipase family protein [Bacteroidaceae bacterium]|nr:GDSL-type esterase/lipase family protein [Bacteroidaceae bacterium]